jgi:malate dehydrogenase
MRAMAGDANVVECAYVASSLITDMPFFASQLRLGPGGVEGRQGPGDSGRA